jgi:VIT1/CCC1 family predicted Fe2+/Mn2+ transporter
MSLDEVFERNLEHKVHKAGWLRAAVLGANDGLVATASLMIGIAAAGKNDFIFTGGAAGIAAGAMSMAVGEYVSVRSQSDIELADRRIEAEHLAIDPDGELEELIHIYMQRGLTRELATQVARAMHEKDALEAHLRDELGQFEHTKARPVQAAIASAIAYTCGGIIPLLGALAPTHSAKVTSIVLFTIAGLTGTGFISSRLAGSPLIPTSLRVIIGGSLGMAITAGIGSLVHLSGI